MFAAATAQQGTYFNKQGSTMYRSIGPHFKIEPPIFQSLTGITILTAVPLYDRVLVPMARKITKQPTGITILQRMGVGIFVAVVMLVVSALVEAKRVNIAKANGLIDNLKAPIPMSIWWLAPQYVLCGIADVFTIIGMQEFFYDQVPEEMRSIGAALYISTVGVGSFMSSGIISIVDDISSKYWNGEGWMVSDNLNRAHLDNFYWLLAALTGISLLFFVWASRGFVYKMVDSEDNKYDA